MENAQSIEGGVRELYASARQGKPTLPNGDASTNGTTDAFKKATGKACSESACS